jgi:GNAT superfamily N-acetyltransferase
VSSRASRTALLILLRPEQKQYAENYERLISADSPNQKAEADVKKKIKAERDLAYPDLWRKTSHLHILVTLPSSRGTGTGGALLAEFVRQAREEGKGMTLSTPTESNVSTD